MVPMCLNLPSWNRKYFVRWLMKYTHRFVFWNLFEFPQLLRYKAVGGGFELALACDFLVVEASATLFSVEIMGGMLPGASGVQCTWCCRRRLVTVRSFS
jgi:hypothetical protein